jgi:hypothetical protein
VGRIGLDAAGRVGELVGQPRPLGPGLVALQEPQQVLALGLGGVEGAEFLGHRGLHLEAADLLAELVADVLEADQVVAGVGQAPFGLAATLAVFGDAGGLFEEAAHLFGPRLDDPRDHPLLDDRVGPRAQAGAEEQVDHVLAADLHPVDVIGGLAAAVEHALHRHLGVGLPLAGGAAFGVVEDQLDAGPRHRLAGGRAVEDHVLHRAAAQGRGPRLAQHPAHRVDDVGLAAAVRPHHAHQIARREHGRRVDEGLETGKLEFGETHGSLMKYAEFWGWSQGFPASVPANMLHRRINCGRYNTIQPKRDQRACHGRFHGPLPARPAGTSFMPAPGRIQELHPT